MRLGSLFSAGLCALLFAAAAGAQAPLLQVQVGPDNAIHLQNTYTAPATAYLVQVEITLAHGRARSGRQCDGLEAPRTVLGPGESAALPLLQIGAGGARPLPAIQSGAAIRVAELAVIYADGATAGPPELVTRLLRARGFRLLEMETGLAALARLDGDDDWRPEQQELAQEGAAEQLARRTAGVRPGGNALRDLSAELEMPADIAPAKRARKLAMLRERYQKQIVLYGASLPAPILPGDMLAAPAVAACGPAGADQLALQCQFSGGQLAVTMTNPRSAGASAIYVGYCHPKADTPAGDCGRPASGMSFDTLPQLGGSAGQDLQPGSTRQVSLQTLNGSTLQSAVIYEDGVTAGNADLIQAFLQQRAATLADLRLVIPRLRAAAANPASDREALATEFEQRAAAQEAELRGQGGGNWGLPPGLIYHALAQLLRRPSHDGTMPPLSLQLEQALREASITLRRLEASQPPLADPGR